MTEKPESERKYQIDVSGNTLNFHTTSFKPGRGSLLHTGIFSLELASSLAAGGVAFSLAFAFFFVSGNSLGVWHFILAMVLFGVFFLLFRKFVFYPFFESLLIFE